MNEKSKRIVKVEIKILEIFIILILLLILNNIVNPSKLVSTYYRLSKFGTRLEYIYTYPGKTKYDSIEYKDEESAFGKFKIWFPDESDDKKYPLIVMCNGTYMHYEIYEPLFEHFASWGFVIVGNNDRFSGNGESTIKSLELALKENDNPESKLYNKIDATKIGVLGHSRGGAAIYNAINNFEEGKIFKSIFAVSPVHQEMSKSNLCYYEYKDVNVPMMIIASTGDKDAKNFMPYEKLKKMFDTSKSNNIIIARRNRVNHGEILVRTSGYCTAWFLYTLCDDEMAKSVFFGDSPDIIDNMFWQDFKFRWGV